MKRILLGLSLTIALMACSRGGGSPAAVVEDFARKMESGSCSGVQDMLTASSRGVAGPKLEQACQAAAEMRKNDPKAKGKTIKAMKVLESKEEGDRATVRLETEYSDGTKEAGDAITLVREDGRWKIDLMATGMSGGGGGESPQAPAMAPATPAPAPAPEAAAEPADEPADETSTEEGTNEAAQTE